MLFLRKRLVRYFNVLTVLQVISLSVLICAKDRWRGCGLHRHYKEGLTYSVVYFTIKKNVLTCIQQKKIMV